MFQAVSKMTGIGGGGRDRSNTEITDEMRKTWQDYMYTVGEDIEQKEAIDAKKMGKKKKPLWFVKKGPKMLKKVFVSFKVKRISDINNVKEQFRIKMHIYFNWLPTFEEYESYIEAKQKGDLYGWEPKWYPHLEFMNQIDAIMEKWEEYPDEGRFRMQQFKDWFGKDGEACDDKKSPFERKQAYFIRAKYDIEMVMSEELELQSFPFDCQDLSVIIREGTQDVTKVFLPELRKPKFGAVDPRYSVIDEWDMEAARIEFGTTNAGASRSSQTYPMIILRLKMKRRWGVYMWNVVFLMACIESLGLCCFALDLPYYDDDLGEIVSGDEGARLGLAMTLVLTAVAFLHVVKSNLPSVPYLTFLDLYVLSGYLFLIFIMVETATVAKGLVRAFSQDWDTRAMYICIVYLILYHMGFAWYAVKLRKDELNKLVMDSDEIEQEVNLTRPALKFDFRTGTRDGTNKRLLVFQAIKQENSEKEKGKEKGKEGKDVVKSKTSGPESTIMSS